jgi:RNA polymerase sigma-70 factor, ECF subfamily
MAVGWAGPSAGRCPVAVRVNRCPSGGGTTTGSQDQRSGGSFLPDARSAAGPGDSTAEPTDADLLSRHIGGDADAFGLVFGRHRDRLWAVAIRTLGDPEEAADALQDAMISAFRRAASFRGDSAVTTWLHRIVVNACLDRMRRKSARPAATSGHQAVLDGLASSGPVPDPAGVTDTAIDVMTELRKLVPEQQAALVLVDMLGYSVSDAAEVLEVSESTVKSRCARGRARLLPRLAHLRPPAIRSQGRPTRSAGPHVLPAHERSEDAP